MAKSGGEFAKRDFLGLKTKVQVEKTALASQTGSVGLGASKASALKAELEKLKIQEESVRQEIQKDEAIVLQKKSELGMVDQKIKTLQTEETQAGQTGKTAEDKVGAKKKEVEKLEADLNVKDQQVRKLQSDQEEDILQQLYM